MLNVALTHPVCNLCDVKMNSMEVFGTHMKNVHGETDDMRIKRLEHMFSLDYKQESSIKIVQIDQHTQDFSCTECGVKLDSREQQNSHNEEYHNTKSNKIMFECEICDLKFVTTQGVEYHKKSVHNHTNQPGNKGVTSFICDQCKIAFPKKYILVRHRLQSHKANSLELKIKSVMRGLMEINEI